MSLSRCLFLFVLPLWLVSLFGCSSTRTVYGDRARFSPAFHGYVMAQNDGSDDPSKGDTVLLLRDPVTGNKLRCREEVMEWRELYEDTATDELHDHRAAIAAGITGGTVFGPLLALEPIGSLIMWQALSTTESIYKLLASDDPEELFGAATALFERKRFSQASLLIERALAKDGAVGIHQKAYSFLGLAYAEQGKQTRARTALTAFFDRAAEREVDGYRRSEAT